MDHDWGSPWADADDTVPLEKGSVLGTRAITGTDDHGEPTADTLIKGDGHEDGPAFGLGETGVRGTAMLWADGFADASSAWADASRSTTPIPVTAVSDDVVVPPKVTATDDLAGLGGCVADSGYLADESRTVNKSEGDDVMWGQEKGGGLSVPLEVDAWNSAHGWAQEQETAALAPTRAESPIAEDIPDDIHRGNHSPPLPVPEANSEFVDEDILEDASSGNSDGCGSSGESSTEDVESTGTASIIKDSVPDKLPSASSASVSEEKGDVDVVTTASQDGAVTPSSPLAMQEQESQPELSSLPPCQLPDSDITTVLSAEVEQPELSPVSNTSGGSTGGERQTEDESADGVEEDDFGDFAEGEEGFDEEPAPTDEESKSLPNKNLSAFPGQAHIPPFDIDLSLVSKLYLIPVSDPEIPPLEKEVISTIEARKAWYRVSQAETLRKSNSGSDDYVRVAWSGSKIQEKVNGIVEKWISTEKSLGGTGLGRNMDPGAMFGWGAKPSAGAKRSSIGVFNQAALERKKSHELRPASIAGLPPTTANKVPKSLDVQSAGLTKANGTALKTPQAVGFGWGNTNGAQQGSTNKTPERSTNTVADLTPLRTTFESPPESQSSRTTTATPATTSSSPEQRQKTVATPATSPAGMEQRKSPNSNVGTGGFQSAILPIREPEKSGIPATGGVQAPKESLASVVSAKTNFDEWAAFESRNKPNGIVKTQSDAGLEIFPELSSPITDSSEAASTKPTIVQPMAESPSGIKLDTTTKTLGKLRIPTSTRHPDNHQGKLEPTTAITPFITAGDDWGDFIQSPVVTSPVVTSPIVTEPSNKPLRPSSWGVTPNALSQPIGGSLESLSNNLQRSNTLPKKLSNTTESVTQPNFRNTQHGSSASLSELPRAAPPLATGTAGSLDVQQHNTSSADVWDLSIFDRPSTSLKETTPVAATPSADLWDTPAVAQKPANAVYSAEDKMVKRIVEGLPDLSYMLQ